VSRKPRITGLPGLKTQVISWSYYTWRSCSLLYRV